MIIKVEEKEKENENNSKINEPNSNLIHEIELPEKIVLIKIVK